MSIEGFWKSRGYGWILKIDPEGYSLYDSTPGACIEFERGTRDEFESGFELLQRDHDEHLALRIRHDITGYDFDRLTALPDAALLMDEPRRSGVIENFDCFCEVFRQDYAFFDLRGVAWEKVCAEARSEINGDSSPEDLFRVLHSLIAPLRDNHVMLTDGRKMVNSEKVADVKVILQSELGLTSSSIGDPQSIALISPFINRTFLGDRGKVAGNGAIIWGMITPTVAYLNVLKLYGLCDTEEARTVSDLPPRRPDHARFLRENLDAIELIMDEVMADLAPARSVILDIRLNGGGFDNVGMAIAGRFADRKRLAFTKHTRDGNEVTPLQEFFTQPAGEFQFTGPVYVLTSVRTASAGDIFALCMRSLPHVTLVGQPSTGILSDNLKKHLPNGWTTSISNEFYYSADSMLFEGPGVPVDVETPVFVEHNFRSGFRIAVDKALELTAGQAGIRSAGQG